MRAIRSGYKISCLLFLEKPEFSVHRANLRIIKATAEACGYPLHVVKLDREDYSPLISFLQKMDIDGLVTGNVKLDILHETYNKICEELKIKLIEPLWNHDTFELLTNYLKENIKFIIIGIRENGLSLNWLGQTIHQENVQEFLTDCITNGIDPCGEYGEFHTLTIHSPIFKKTIKWNTISKRKSSNLLYTILTS